MLDANVLEELCLSDELFVDLPFLSMGEFFNCCFAILCCVFAVFILCGVLSSLHTQVHAGLNNGATEPKDQAKVVTFVVFKQNT